MTTHGEANIAALTVNVVVPTFRRPQQLCRGLLALERAARLAPPEVTVGVSVVDDDRGQSAEVVARAFSDRFDGGLQYLVSGSANISRARNVGLEATMGSCTWIGWLDDDVQVPDTWFIDCWRAVEGSDFSAVTGSLLKDHSQGPAWLREQPFERIGITSGEDGAYIDMCATGNCWVSADFVVSHPDLRFDELYGKSGGEDVQFFSRAVGLGLRPVFCQAASVSEPQGPERCTFRYQVRRAFWLGLLEADLRQEVSRRRIVARAAKRAVTANAGSLSAEDRHRRGARYTIAVLAQCVGMVVGVLGVKIDHK